MRRGSPVQFRAHTAGLQHGGDFLIILLDVPLLAESLPPKSSQDAGGQTSSLLEQVWAA